MKASMNCINWSGANVSLIVDIAAFAMNDYTGMTKKKKERNGKVIMHMHEELRFPMTASWFVQINVVNLIRHGLH